MLAILATMGRPILFVQNRIGRGGEAFAMYKLRTMRQRMPRESARATALNDDRITPLGRVLRKYHIDELPQMWNVLRGDMSLVGPRPEQPELALDYAEQMPAYSYRHLVRPGITGWSQVCFGYAENYSETREKLTFDLHYIKYMSFVMDFSIAAMTVRILCKGALVR
jgi:lipopolysaccharide/colanic/teichoic acid biosynthesis glycosyltransferase